MFVAEIERVVIEVNALVLITVDKFAKESFHVVRGIVSNGSDIRTVRIIPGHRRGPNTEDALEWAPTAAPNLGMRRNLRQGVFIPVSVRTGVIKARERGRVHFLRGQQVEVNDSGGTVHDAHTSLFILAPDTGMHRMLIENGFGLSSRDRTGYDDFRIRQNPVNVVQQRRVMLPAGCGALDKDVLVLFGSQMAKVGFILFP